MAAKKATSKKNAQSAKKEPIEAADAVPEQVEQIEGDEVGSDALITITLTEKLKISPNGYDLRTFEAGRQEIAVADVQLIRKYHLDAISDK